MTETPRFAWRPLLRSCSAYSLVLVPILLLAGFLVVTRFPSSEPALWLAQLPVVGSSVDRVRTMYLPPPLVAPPGDASVDDRGTAGPSGDSSSTQPDPSETLFVGIGAALRERPNSRSPLVLQTERLGEYRIVSRRGPWVELELPGSPSGTVWLDQSAARDLTPPLGSAPAANLPIPARAASEEVRAAARAAMRGAVWESEYSGYHVISDVEREIADRILGALRGIERAYRERFGVRPIGEAAESIALFASQQHYFEYQGRVDGLQGLERGVSTGHASGGLAALYVGDRQIPEVQATLVHEVAHLLNRRALGPALPLWLDEGIAEDLAYFSGPIGRPLAEYRIQTGNHVRIWGPLAALQTLFEEGRPAPTLQELAAYEQDLFVRSRDPLRLYTLSAFLLRFLLSDSLSPTSAEATRAFLREVAAGKAATMQNLAASLSRSLASRWTVNRLESEFLDDLERLFQETPALVLDPAPAEKPAA